MQAVWNAIETKAMSHDENLLNTCRQLEQEYIDWRRPMTHGGSYITRLWPAVGELDNLSGKLTVVRFITGAKGTIRVYDAQGQPYGVVKAMPGMVGQLYALANLIDRRHRAALVREPRKEDGKEWTRGILTKPIPAGDFGRPLTSLECQRLRAIGHKLNTQWIVVRHADNPTLGILYRPGRQFSEYLHAGIYITN